MRDRTRREEKTPKENGLGDIDDRKDKEDRKEKKKMLVDDKINVGDIAERETATEGSADRRRWKGGMKLWVE